MRKARRPRVGRPNDRRLFFDDPATDQVLTMLLTLSSEVWSLRERLTAWEAITTQKGLLPEGEVDAFEFTAEQEARLAEQRRDFVASLFSVLEAPSPKERVRSRPRAGRRATSKK